jgi:hypothetical protein
MAINSTAMAPKSTAVKAGLPRKKPEWVLMKPPVQSLFKIWNFGVANAKILPCRLQKEPKIGVFAVY